MSTSERPSLHPRWSTRTQIADRRLVRRRGHANAVVCERERVCVCVRVRVRERVWRGSVPFLSPSSVTTVARCISLLTATPSSEERGDRKGHCRVSSTLDAVDSHLGDVAGAKVRRAQEGPHPRQSSTLSTLSSFSSSIVDMPLRSACSRSRPAVYILRRGCKADVTVDPPS